MPQLHLSFSPDIAFLQQDEENPSFQTEVDKKIYPITELSTLSSEQIAQLNELIRPELIEDKIYFQENGIGITNLDVLRYEFNLTDGLIHIWYQDGDGPNSPISGKDVSELLFVLDPEEGGPDTWMGGDIQIVDDPEQFGYTSIELHPYLKAATEIDDEGKEHPIDVDKLKSRFHLVLDHKWKWPYLNEFYEDSSSQPPAETSSNLHWRERYQKIFYDDVKSLLQSGLIKNWKVTDFTTADPRNKMMLFSQQSNGDFEYRAEVFFDPSTQKIYPPVI